jgi:hypothetical protein
LSYTFSFLFTRFNFEREPPLCALLVCVDEKREPDLARPLGVADKKLFGGALCVFLSFSVCKKLSRRPARCFCAIGPCLDKILIYCLFSLGILSDYSCISRSFCCPWSGAALKERRGRVSDSLAAKTQGYNSQTIDVWEATSQCNEARKGGSVRWRPG